MLDVVDAGDGGDVGEAERGLRRGRGGQARDEAHGQGDGQADAPRGGPALDMPVARVAGCTEMAPPKLGIVVVSWNTRDLTVEALRSVERQAVPFPLEVVVVDNASADDSADAVEAGFPRVRVIRNLVNLGFAAANNQALRDLRTEYVLLLNPDTVIEEDGLLAGWIAFTGRHS